MRWWNLWKWLLRFVEDNEVWRVSEVNIWNTSAKMYSTSESQGPNHGPWSPPPPQPPPQAQHQNHPRTHPHGHPGHPPYVPPPYQHPHHHLPPQVIIVDVQRARNLPSRPSGDILSLPPISVLTSLLRRDFHSNLDPPDCVVFKCFLSFRNP